MAWSPRPDGPARRIRRPLSAERGFASSFSSLRRLGAAIACTLVLLGIGGCAARVSDPAATSSPPPAGRSVALEASDAIFAEDEGVELPSVSDPLETVNRGIFAANRLLDRLLLGPLARAYGWAVPDWGKDAVRGVFDNLNQPVVVLNDLLQGEGQRAGTAGARFLLNSTFGVGGIWDPAARVGLAAHTADFGQTLGRAGLGPGPYLVLPIVGPSTTRDAFGSAVDLALRPDIWLLPFSGQLAVASTDGISLREQKGEALSALEESAVDFYVAVRSAYLAQREAQVRRAAQPEP